MSKPRKELEDMILAAGHLAEDTVTSSTTHVCQGVIGGAPAMSSKLKKAQKLGVPVITEDQLAELLKVKP